MESAFTDGPIMDLKQSSVVPAHITGDGKDKDLTDLDLALKLHYIKGVYYFGPDAGRGLTIEDFKASMFLVLNCYNLASGRIRRSEETGRPFIKCNDSGVRVLEGYCDMTLEESLGFEEVEVDGVHERRVSLREKSAELLVYDGVIGPDLGFSPLVYVQFTRFKCGGVAIGLNCAHVLGDPISASTFINTWARVLHGHKPPQSLHVPGPFKPPLSLSEPRKLNFLKRVEPRGDHWIPARNPNMRSHSFHLTPKQLNAVFSGPVQKDVAYFETLSALVWKSVSKTRGDSGPKAVTVCTILTGDRELEIPCNKVSFSTVGLEHSPEKMDLHKLASLIRDKKQQQHQEEENPLPLVVENDVDYIAYGTKLTFVDMEGADVYGLELRGHKPVFVDYHIGGVGEEGTVLLLPGPGGAGRTLAVTLPEDQLVDLSNELLGIA